jgi:hypothetical protein
VKFRLVCGWPAGEVGLASLDVFLAKVEAFFRLLESLPGQGAEVAVTICVGGTTGRPIEFFWFGERREGEVRLEELVKVRINWSANQAVEVGTP